MTTILAIAGHGENSDGSFDPGALGFIKKGEHKYYEEDFFPAMKKFLPKKHNIVFFSEYNVFDHRNLVSLAKRYGDDTIVVEFHYDAFTPDAKGGHVVIHEKYSPDNLDLRIRDVIKKHIGVRYTHKGQSGIDGRTNLGNANRAANGNLNYRLIELGFGTNEKDSTVMIKNIEAVAKDMVIALVGSAKDEKEVIKEVPVNTPIKTEVIRKTVDQLAKEVIQGAFGSGEDRKKALGSEFEAVQKRVNELLGSNVKVPAVKSIDTLVKETLAGVHGNGDARMKSLESNYDAVMDKINSKKVTAAKPATKSIDTLVKEVMAGKHGNGDARKKSLGSNYTAVMKAINGESVSNKKSVAAIAKEVITGKFGNGTARKANVEKAGYNYDDVQKAVNKLL